MNKALRGMMVLAWMCLCASAGTPQTSASVPDPRYAQGMQALEQGSPVVALDIANSILGQIPNDYQALILLSLGSSQIGRHHDAAAAAAAAYNAAIDDEQRVTAARLAGAEYFATGQFTRAEWWLRRAANNTRSENELAQLKREFDTVRDANPFRAQIGFSIAPSNNVNGGSAEAFFTLGDFEFEFGPSSRALSGIEYAGNAEVSYHLFKNQNHITEAAFYLYGRTYTLSPASQATVPDISGSDYAYSVAAVSLGHRGYFFEGLGVTGVKFSIGQTWQAGIPIWRYVDVAMSQGFYLGENASAEIRLAIQDRKALDAVQSDTLVYDLDAVYALSFDNQDSLRLMLGYRLNDAIDPTYTYTDISVSAIYSLQQPVFGANVSLEIGGGYKNYDEFSLSLDGRRDAYLKVGATAAFNNVSYYGFSPIFSASAIQTKSNVARYSTLEFQGSIGIQSNF